MLKKILEDKHAMLSELQARLDSTSSQLAAAQETLAEAVALRSQDKETRRVAEEEAQRLREELREGRDRIDDTMSTNSRLQVGTVCLREAPPTYYRPSKTFS